MEPNRSLFDEEADRIRQLQRLRSPDGHRFFTRSNNGNGTQNVLLKVLTRQHSGYLATGLNKRSHEQPFPEVPEQLKFCLKNIVPYCYLNGPHMLLNKYFHVCLFDDHVVDDIKTVTITQWKTDNGLLIVHGDNGYKDSDSYVTMVRVPKLGCLDCKQVRDAHEGDEQRQDILCIGCNMTIHMKYRNTDSGPRFNPSYNLNCPGYIIMNENSIIHTINVRLDTSRSQPGGGGGSVNPTAVLSSKYFGRDSPQREAVAVEEGRETATPSKTMDTTSPPKQPDCGGSMKKFDPETSKCDAAMTTTTTTTAFNPEMSIAQQIIADFAEYETDMYETKCSIRNYPDNFDELIITSPVASTAQPVAATTESNMAQVRLMNHRNNTNIELRLDGGAERASSSSSSAGGMAGPSARAAVSSTSPRKSYVTRVDLQSGESSPCQEGCGSAGTGNQACSSVPMCDMTFTASSSTTALAPSISRSPLRRRFDLAEPSYVPNIQIAHQHSTLPLQQRVVNGANGANFHVTSAGGSALESDADSAAKAYEFSEDNERCEKISAFRKRRLADKRYEFSEEPTSEENIEPFNRLRNQIRARVTAPGYSAAHHHHASYADLISSTHHLHRASPNHGFRSPCGSPVGNRYLRSPPGIRSPSYYRHRSPSSQAPHGSGSVVMVGNSGGSTPSTAGPAAAPMKQPKRSVPLDPRDYIQILSPGGSMTSASGSNETGTPDIPKFFMDAVQKINARKLANEQLLLDEFNNENNINGDNQLPTKRSGTSDVPSGPSKQAADIPTCTKRIVKIYVEEDDANSVVTMEDDDCISPGYHASLPMEVHGSCYSKMQIISQASFNKLNCPAVVVTQNSFDMEMFSFHVANYICAQNNKKYDILLDSAYELTHVCPLTETITCTTVLQFTANDIGNSKPKSCQNCSTTIDCQTHRKIYQCRSLFTWCITTGEYVILDYGHLVSGPYLEERKLFSNYNHLLKKLRSFTKKLFASEGRGEMNRTYEYLRHVRVLDSDMTKTKRRLTDLENMIEFYLRRPRIDGDYSGTDSDYEDYEYEEEGDDDVEEEEDEEDDDGDSSSDEMMVVDRSFASDTVSDDDDL
uniref:DDB1- and CUL4-associated factor 15 WD40 repeat-containing domain-containing protein n=1 Tax=Anopheles epiroticus TaxID=199890 RepID=A0A182PNI8_9DIPT